MFVRQPTTTTTPRPRSRFRCHGSRTNERSSSSINDGMIRTAASDEFLHRCSNVPFEEIYTMIDDLSRGRFSSVRKCAKKDAEEQIFAAKIVKKRHVQQAINELRVFQYAQKHPQFVTLFDVFDGPTEAIFILELSGTKSLDETKRRTFPSFQCPTRRSAVGFGTGRLSRRARRGTRGETSVGRRGVSSRTSSCTFGHQGQRKRRRARADRFVPAAFFQPQNILLMEKWPSTQIKLCDFGLSRVLSNECLCEISGTTDFLGSFVRSSTPFVIRLSSPSARSC